LINRQKLNSKFILENLEIAAKDWPQNKDLDGNGDRGEGMPHGRQT